MSSTKVAREHAKVAFILRPAVFSSSPSQRMQTAVLRGGNFGRSSSAPQSGQAMVNSTLRKPWSAASCRLPVATQAACQMVVQSASRNFADAVGVAGRCG